MPKRGGASLKSYYRAKRHYASKGKTRIAQPNRFINQLGGWSTNKPNRSTAVLRPVTTTKFQLQITQARTRGQLTFEISNIPQSIKDVYMRVRVKKITVFCLIGGNNENSAVQFSICKSLQTDTNIDPRNVPGAQVKLMDLGGSGTTPGGGISDVIRCSRMYPPIEVTVDSAVAGGAPLTKENWLSTDAANTSWTCFNFDCAGVGAATLTMDYYFTVELLCDGMKA